MKRILTAAAAASLAMPAAAAAQDGTSSCQAYNPQLCQVRHNQRATGAAGTGTLPFTGLDVALLAVGGGGLLGTGLVVRRLSSGTE